MAEEEHDPHLPGHMRLVKWFTTNRLQVQGAQSYTLQTKNPAKVHHQSEVGRTLDATCLRLDGRDRREYQWAGLAQGDADCDVYIV